MSFSGFVLKGFREYYAEIWYVLSTMFGLIFRILIFYFLWLALVGNKVGEVLTYLILAQIFWYAGPFNLPRKINNEVREGTFDIRLLRPSSVIAQYLFEGFGTRIVRFFTLFALLFLIFSYANLSVNIFFLLPAFLLSYLSHYFLLLSLGFLVFWFGDAKPFYWIVSKIIMISQVIPHHYLPTAFQWFFDLLPGKYTVYYPVEMAIRGVFFFEPVVYTFFMFLMTIFIVRLSIKKINVYGG